MKYKLFAMSKFSKREAFTLTEILIAIAVISIGIFAMIGLVIVVIKGNKQGRDMAIATNLAQQKMETILNTTYNSISTSNSDIGTDTIFTDYRDGHRLKVVIDSDTPADKMKTITVFAYWNPATSTSSHNIELKSIKSQ